MGDIRFDVKGISNFWVLFQYQILCFLQTRSGDRADRLRIEQLERALSAKNAETAMLSAKLKQLEQYQVISMYCKFTCSALSFKEYEGMDWNKPECFCMIIFNPCFIEQTEIHIRK